MEPLNILVARAQSGDVRAFGELVESTQAAVYAAARSVLRDPAEAEDAAQQAYLRAFRRLHELHEPAAFGAWMRRIAITSALNIKRAQRRVFLRLDDVPEVPILDEGESSWSEPQRRRLAAALLGLSPEDRQLCDRRYHGRWSTQRLAQTAGVDQAIMRKRLQRIRDRLRKEIEAMERRDIAGESHPDLPARVVELLARPRLTDLPDNPVGRVLDQLRAVFPEFTDHALPEVIDLAGAMDTIAADAMYVDAVELHRVDERQILRYDLTLPILTTLRYEGRPLKMWSHGKCYRAGKIDAMHLEAFHQAEVFWLDDKAAIDPWQFTGRVLQAADVALPGRTVKIVPTEYAMCQQAWELAADVDGVWNEVLAWGVFSDKVVKHVGGDPARHRAVGLGFGLERLAMLRYGIDDIRKIDVASVA
jgi:RNA polymerase sigma-70 factor (ECF subfamily)